MLEELRMLPGCDKTKAAVLRLLRSHAGDRMYVSQRATRKREQMAEARRLLRQGLTRAEVARRLSDHFGFCTATGYRRIALVLGPPA